MNIFKKTVLTGALLAGSLFTAQNAYAQDRFNEDDKPVVEKKEAPKQETKVDLKDDNSTLSRKLDEMFRGSLQIKAEHEPLVNRFSGSAEIEGILGKWRPYIAVQDVFEKWNNLDDSELEVNSIREVAALGFYALNSKEFELYFRPVLGNENSTFKDAINMKAHRIIYGAEAGIASVEHGYKVLGKFYKGTGKFDAELNSGFEIDGDFDTTFAGLEGRVALYRDGKKQSGSAEFDKRQDDRDAACSIELIADLYWNRNEFGELERDDTIQFRLGPAFTWNSRDENGSGSIWTVTPYAAYKQIATESGISLRETETRTIGGGAIVTYSPSRNWSISGTLGYNQTTQDIDDPGQNFDKSDKKGGVVAGLVIKFDF